VTDWGQWLPGLGSDDEDDPVKKALRALGLGPAAGAEPAPSYNDVGVADIRAPQGTTAGGTQQQPIGVDPRGADTGPWEQPYPGTVTPIRNPDGSVTTERSITVTEPDLNRGAATNIPTVWGGQVVPDDTAVQNAVYSRRGFPSYGSIDDAVSAAEQRSRDLGAGQATSVGGAEVPPDVLQQPSEPRWSLPDVASPVWGVLGSAGSAIGRGIQGVTDQIGANMAGNRAAVEDANAGQSGGVDFGTGASRVGSAVATGLAEGGPAEAGRVLAEEGPYLAGMRPPETPMEVAYAAMPAPARLGKAVEDVASAYGAGAGRRAAAELGLSEDPTIGGMVSPQDVAAFAGGALTDPLTYVGGGRANAAIEAAQGGLIRAAAGPIRGAARRVGEGLAGNAERVAAADARMAAEGGTQLAGMLGAVPEEARPLYQPTPPGGALRRYHGTASAFDAADPGSFNEQGLYGPGYYTTSDPRVASSYGAGRATHADFLTEEIADAERQIAYHREQMAKPSEERLVRSAGYYEGKIAEQEARMSDLRAELPNAGPNVRAVDVPPEVRLLDVDAPLTGRDLDAVDAALAPLRRSESPTSRAIAREFDDEIARLGDDLARRRTSGQAPLEAQALYDALSGAAERVPDMGRGLATEVLERAGWDGIAHKGGQRVPMLDAAGTPIEHDVTVVFPGSVNKVRNAFSGTYGGATLGTLPPGASPDRLAGVNRVLSQGLASTFSGGIGAQVNEQMNPDDPYARLRGFAAGALVPPLAARGGMALARRAGRSTELGDAARIALGDVPPSKIRRPELPGLESLPARGVGEVPLAASPGDAAARAEMRAGSTALPGLEGLAAERFAPVRAAVPGATPSEAAAALSEMRAGGAAELPSMPPPKGPSFWEWLKKIGYTGLIGPSSAAGQTVGGLMQAGLGTEKAVARAIAEGRPGSAPRIVGSALGAVPEGFRSLFEVMRGGQAPAGISDAWGGGTARMADRVQTPLGKLTARALDYSTELWAQAPDAFFSPIFRAIGEREAAEKAAQKTGASATQLMADAAAARAAGARGSTSAVQDVMDAGRKLADDLGMKGDPGSFGQKLAALSKKDSAAGFMASFLLPFPSMTVRSLKATGRLIPGVGEVIGRAEGRDAFERLHDQTLGPLALAAMGYYATQGGITGSGPTDKGHRDILTARGWQPHSILTPAGYVPTRYFQQFAPILDAVGEVHDGYAYGKGGADKGAIVGDLATRLGKLATDQVGLGQLNDLLQVLDGSQSEDQGAALLARSLGRYIPFGATIRQATSALDPTARRPEGRSPDEYLPTTSFIQNLEQGLPGLRSLVPERQDVLGRAMPNPQRGLQPAMRTEPMLRTFERAGVAVGDPPSTIKDANSGAERRLTDAQRARWRTAYGRALRSRWADSGMPTDRETLGTVKSKARAEADAVVGG
jgi:hypothetical protein